MSRLDSILLKVFLYGLPLLILQCILAYSYSSGTIEQTAAAKLLNNSAGLVIGLWMLLSIYLCVRLLFSGPLRNRVLARLTFIREGDEREAMLTGKATKTTFLTSLALLIFLFCLSCFQVSIYQVPPAKAVDGKTRMLTLGFGVNLLASSEPAQPAANLEKKDLVSYAGLPLSGTAIILLLILWQVISYNYSVQKLIKAEGKIT